MLKATSDRILFLVFSIISLLSYGSIVSGNLFNMLALGSRWGDCTYYAYDWECSNVYFSQITEWLRAPFGLPLITGMSIDYLMMLVLWIIIVGLIQGISILVPFLLARKVLAWVNRGS